MITSRNPYDANSILEANEERIRRAQELLLILYAGCPRGRKDVVSMALHEYVQGLEKEYETYKKL